jgi:hypothetical protein
MQSMDEGKDYEAQWGRPIAGSGPYAWMIKRRFETAARRLGYRETPATLRADLFRKPSPLAGDAAARLLAGAPREGSRRFADQVLERP